MSMDNESIQKLSQSLGNIKAPKNWGELTGPFFHLQLPGESPIGPFQGSDLKTFCDQNELPEETQIKDAKGVKDWQSIFSHPYFQRRRPQLISTQDFPEDFEEVYFLVEGVKEGPVTPRELDELIDQREILLTDQVSFDNGHTWKKLFEYEEYDRRDLSADKLPESPGWDVFKGSNEEIDQGLTHPSQELIETEAIAGLAFIEAIKSGKTAKFYDKKSSNLNMQGPTKNNNEADILELPPQVPVTEGRKKTSLLPKAAAMVFILVMIGGSLKFLSESMGPKSVPNNVVNSDTPQEQEVKQTSGQKPTRNSFQSPSRRARTKARSRRPASITEGESFREASERRRMEDRPYEDDYQDPSDEEYNQVGKAYGYDNGDTPVEQDPIRGRLDKKTIDSSKNYYDDDTPFGDQEINAPDAGANGDAPTLEPTSGRVQEVWGNGSSANGQRFPNALEEEVYPEDAQYEEFYPEDEAF